MKIAVLGAGAMGSLYGAKLSHTQDVTMVDVNETLINHINQNGIVVQEADGTDLLITYRCLSVYFRQPYCISLQKEKPFGKILLQKQTFPNGLYPSCILRNDGRCE